MNESKRVAVVSPAADGHFRDRRVVLIGGTSGIGAAIGERFAALGASVIVAGLRSREIPPRWKFVSREVPRTDMGWEVDAQGLYDVLSRVWRDYGPLPLYVTENGAAYADEVAADGTVADPLRVEYLDSHFRTAHRASPMA